MFFSGGWVGSEPMRGLIHCFSGMKNPVLKVRVTPELLKQCLKTASVMLSSGGAMTYSAVMHISNLFSSEFAHSRPLSTSSERSNGFTITSHSARKKKKKKEILKPGDPAGIQRGFASIMWKTQWP